MAALKVKLVRSLSGHTENHRKTVAALGLKKLNSERILPDTPATRGMIAQVSYLLEWSVTEEAFKPFGVRRTGKSKA